MEGSGGLPVNETRPLDRDTLLILRERLGALAVDIEFEPSGLAADASDLEKAKQVGENQAVKKVMAKIEDLITDLLQAAGTQ